MSKPIRDFLPIFFKEEEWKIKLFSQWHTIVGGLSSKMRIEKIEQGTLFIGVYHAVWLQELYSLAHVLKKSINDHLGNNYITFIKFKQATKQQTNSSKKPSIQEKDSSSVISCYNEKVLLQESEKQALEKIKDKELQTILHYFLTRCYYQKIH